MKVYTILYKQTTVTELYTGEKEKTFYANVWGVYTSRKQAEKNFNTLVNGRQKDCNENTVTKTQRFFTVSSAGVVASYTEREENKSIIEIQLLCDTANEIQYSEHK